MTVGENIKRIRKEKGLTQKKLSELSGINEAQIRRYELGGKNANPKIETIQKIAQALEVYTYDLLFDEKTAHEMEQQDFAEISMRFINDGILDLPDDDISGEILLRNFNRLNRLGKAEAFKRIGELTYVPSYIDTSKIPKD